MSLNYHDLLFECHEDEREIRSVVAADYFAADVEFGVPIAGKNLGVVARADLAFGTLVLMEFALAVALPCEQATAQMAPKEAANVEQSLADRLQTELEALARQSESMRVKLLSLFAGDDSNDDDDSTKSNAELPTSRLRRVLKYNSFGLVHEGVDAGVSERKKCCACTLIELTPFFQLNNFKQSEFKEQQSRQRTAQTRSRRWPLVYNVAFQPLVRRQLPLVCVWRLDGDSDISPSQTR